MTGRGAWVGTMAIASVGMLLSPVSARAADSLCELHITAAGYPSRTFKPAKPNAFVKVTPPPPGGAVFTTAAVAGALDDAGLRTLSPSAGELKIVRHADLLDLDKRKLDGTRLYASDAPCYADLVVDNTYAILTDTVPKERLGLVTGAIVGGSRLVTTFVLQSWRDGTAKPITYRKKVDSPLTVTTADVTTGSDAARGDLVQASAANLEQFASFVAAKSTK